MKVVLTIYENNSGNMSIDARQVEIEIRSFRIITGEEARYIESKTDGSCIDPYHEYLELTLAKGTTVTFPNSFVKLRFHRKGKGNGMKRKFKAKITFTIDKDHPDYDRCLVNERDGVFEFSDVYRIDEDYLFGYDSPEEYIKEDLLLIAGGGHNSDHVHNIKFEITEI